MARLARVVVPGYPHHVTQRGNRRQAAFFNEGDYEVYLDLMAQWCGVYGVEVWAYCLMPNHVHLIAVPESEEGLCRAIGEAHRRYTRHVNFREGWRGHLWQGRFASFVMEESYLAAAVRYVEMNPVRARLVRAAGLYRWSSARAHLEGEDDLLVKVRPLLDRLGDWRRVVGKDTIREEALKMLRMHERTGRVLGSEGFVSQVEALVGREVRPGKPGRPRKDAADASD
jgi:putative transposase